MKTTTKRELLPSPIVTIQPEETLIWWITVKDWKIVSAASNGTMRGTPLAFLFF